MFTDTHCHVLKEYYEDIETVIIRAQKHNVNRLIVAAYNETSAKEVISLVDKYDKIYGVIGLHPENCQELFDDNLFNNLPAKIIGIGEIGLDYHYGKENKDQQISLFKKQLQLAEKLNLPVVIHSRDATQDTINILKQYHVKGIIHSFSGSLEIAKIYINMGFKLGINGIITFKNSNIKYIYKEISPNNIVLETDSPFLTPVPLRGTANEPANIEIIAQYMAQLYNISTDELAKITNDNIRQIFDI